MADTAEHIASVTAFYGEVGCTRYRGALVKQSGMDISLWGLYDRPGTLICIDLIDRTRKVFRNVVGGHRTLHASGDAHTRVEMKGFSVEILERNTRRDRGVARF